MRRIGMFGNCVDVPPAHAYGNGYDSQGRRYFKKVTVAGTVTLHHRYIYRGYLQIACVDCTRSGHPALWLVTWDPSQATATRPLAIQKDGTWFTYGYDITKNICEVFGPAGYIRTAYSYAPFGNVSASGDVSQPFQWSSEHYDSELDLVYYNFRHYSPSLGRFLSRDPIAEQGGLNLYAFVRNNPNVFFDEQGGAAIAIGGSLAIGLGIGGSLGIGLGLGAGILTGIGIVAAVGIAAIGIISIIDSIPTSDAQVEEDTEEKTDAVPIEKCEPCEDTKRRKTCAPCNPNVGTKMYRYDTTGRCHYVPEVGKKILPHCHNFVVYQVPLSDFNPRSCECRYHEIESTCVPPSDAVPFVQPSGGGIILV